MAEMFSALNMNPNEVNTEVTIDDIDDNIGNELLDLNKAITPELPQRDFNIRTLTSDKLDELRKKQQR